jgi:hypothetical protein
MTAKELTAKGVPAECHACCLQAEAMGLNVPALIAFATKYGATGWALVQDEIAIWAKYGDTFKAMVPDLIAIFTGGSAPA